MNKVESNWHVFWFLAGTIAFITYTFSLTTNMLANTVMSICMGLVSSLVICGVVIVNDKPRQVLSTSLLLVGLLGFLTIPMQPAVTTEGWLIMLVICPILMWIGYKLDRTSTTRK